MSRYPAWRKIAGPALVLVIGIGIEVLSSTPWPIHRPGLFYLAGVIAALYIGGMGAGISSGILAFLLGLVLFSTPGRLFHYAGEDLQSVVALATVIPAVLVMIGALARREERRVRKSARFEALEQYRDMVEGLDAIVWDRDPETQRVTFVSRSAEELLGHPLERWLAEPEFWIERVHPDDRDRIMGLLRSAVAGGQNQVLEYRMLTADGRMVWLRDATRIVRPGQGRPARLRGVVVDITERKRAEEALRASEGNYRMLMERASDGMLISDLDGNLEDANTKACEMLGYAREEMIGRNIRELIDPEDLERQPLRIGELRVGRRILVERKLRRKDGSSVSVEIHATRLDETRLQGICRDISERKRGEEELRQAMSLLSATLDSTADGILVVDLQGRITSTNARFVEMWGIPEHVMASRDDNLALAYVLDQLKEPEAFLTKVRELYAMPEAESFDVLEFKDGRVFERYSKPQRIGGASVGRVWSFRDVTDRRQAEQALRRSEEQLRQAHKMEAIGRLAGGVAHDFNNLLTAILGNSSLMLQELPPQDARRLGAEEIQKAAERATALTSQLLAFSRKQVLELRIVDLNLVVADMHSMLERLIGEHIELVVAHAEDLGHVRADPGQLEQVILNLVVNARDAMAGGGRLVLETSNLDIDETLAREQPHLAPGRYVVLAVSDTGVGMDRETQAHVFEPFFTTKERGKGTGLGLSTVYGIVRQSEGHVAVTSEPNRGSTFRVYLPRVEDPAESPHRDALAPGGSTFGSETILLVEDERMVRSLVSGTLTQRGYRVLEAENGSRALEIAAGHDGPIDLLVTDVVMPGMSGREVAGRLVGRRPGIRVLYISGYTDEDIAHHGVFAAGVSFLQKPFTLEALARKVRESLDVA